MPELHPTNGPIHAWFGLSYTNYLVLNRTLMQSMPIEWQERMVACLREMDDAFEHVQRAEAFDVFPGDEHLVEDLTERQLTQLGITRSWPEGHSSECEDAECPGGGECHPSLPLYRDSTGREMDSGEYVLTRKPDPVPHYNRGRTYIPPRTPTTVTAAD